MTELDRIKEFKDTLCGIQNNEWNNYTTAAWATWFSTWSNYVENGTLPPGAEHPPHRPNN